MYKALFNNGLVTKPYVYVFIDYAVTNRHCFVTFVTRALTRMERQLVDTSEAEALLRRTCHVFGTSESSMNECLAPRWPPSLFALHALHGHVLSSHACAERSWHE